MPDKTVLRRELIIDADCIQITDRVLKQSNEERLLEWNFIINGAFTGSLSSDIWKFGFKIESGKRDLVIVRFKQANETCEILPTKISEKYAKSHSGTKLVIRAITREENIWITRLQVT